MSKLVAFREVKSRLRVHLKQILKLERKPPEHVSTLLILISYEVIGHLFESGAGRDVFAQQLFTRRGLPVYVGQTLFDAVRHGVAHAYRTHRIVVGADEIRPSLAWKGGPHLLLTGVRMSDDGHAISVPASENTSRYLRLRVVVEDLWKDLDAYLQELEECLQSNEALAARVEARADSMLRGNEDRLFPGGPALAAWREYIKTTRWEGPDSPKKEES